MTIVCLILICEEHAVCFIRVCYKNHHHDNNHLLTSYFSVLTINFLHRTNELVDQTTIKHVFLRCVFILHLNQQPHYQGLFLVILFSLKQRCERKGRDCSVALSLLEKHANISSERG